MGRLLVAGFHKWKWMGLISVRQQDPHGLAAEGCMANLVSVFNPDVKKLREAEARRNTQRTSAPERAAQTAQTVPAKLRIPLPVLDRTE